MAAFTCDYLQKCFAAAARAKVRVTMIPGPLPASLTCTDASVPRNLCVTAWSCGDAWAEVCVTALTCDDASRAHIMHRETHGRRPAVDLEQAAADVPWIVFVQRYVDEVGSLPPGREAAALDQTGVLVSGQARSSWSSEAAGGPPHAGQPGAVSCVTSRVGLVIAVLSVFAEAWSRRGNRVNRAFVVDAVETRFLGNQRELRNLRD
jgi:hypothetical protein